MGGDKVDDLEMTSKLEYDNAITVGFINEKEPSEDMKVYMEQTESQLVKIKKEVNEVESQMSARGIQEKESAEGLET